jgi:NADP-dependent 3-hydroxy acid dehydrogenase YdfG
LTEQHGARPVAVITGASSGIGAATTRTLAAHGYRLALLARRVERLEQLAAELGQGTLAIAADVTDRHAVVAAANRIEQDFGCADVLINNAGVMLLGSQTGRRTALRAAGHHPRRRRSDRVGGDPTKTNDAERNSAAAH